jgi:hypothetical protein
MVSQYNENKQTRFIKTKVDDTPKILHLLSCNHCPFLMFDSKTKIAKCARYHSISTDTIDSNVYSYSMLGENIVPIKEIDIPTWCGLCKDVTVINNEYNLYVKSGYCKFDTIPAPTRNLVMISDYYVDYDVKLVKLVSGTNKNRIRFTNSLPATTTTTVTPPVPTHRTCSCCGELLPDVSRKKNYGMCSECWKKHKDDTIVKEHAFINNFRLKRSACWTDEKFKKIKEID